MTDDASNNRRCTGRTRKGRPCRRFAITGGTVCPTHGGSAPQVKAAAQRRHVRRQAEEEWVNTFGSPIETDPTQAVLDVLSWTAGHVAWLRDRVRATSPEALVWGVTTEVDHQSGEFPGLDTTHAAKPNIWVELYGQERDRLVRMAKVAHDMGIEERRLVLAERVGGLMADLLRGVLDELDLTDAQQAAARLAVPRHLALIAGALNDNEGMAG